MNDLYFRQTKALSWELHTGARRHYTCDWAGGGKVKIKSGFSRLYLLESGTAEIKTAGSVHKLNPGYIFLIPGGIEAYYQCTEPMLLNWVHFNVRTGAGFDIFCNERNVLKTAADPEIIESFRHFMRLIVQHSPATLIQAQAVFAMLIEAFIPRSWEDIFTDTNMLERLEPALKMIHESPQIKWKIEQLSAACRMHPVYFNRCFKQIFKQSPKKYLTASIMTKACAMLNDPKHIVTEIALSCGFEDPYHFSRAFKNYSGLSPANYRRQSLQ